ncbi:nucleotidyl transferase AbiEii/AbiGii toxin family protein [Bradyrhizobium niftali]|uniref:Nucleotidyl transferase AbiEii/AbiGii toxin family protein n=1 Tax=Bradyrhizobium niftali TaxID=2560055 RepID=A0A4Y9LZQ6_9BRAD|nr:nucleotidyl transferase AbiEii/AbiGii toxin family protein [Bradyrhizobium niftali]TFV48271.1 nucleotidyl transferase AbiEii/AbiGii toxin family protein [Bradyrhizobium niftali]
MPHDFLHNHPQLADLIRIVAEEKGIDPALVEKDYWIVHCLYGLQQLGFTFQLKGGTSLSKGHGIISRFSEDIDILIQPSSGQDVRVGKNHDKPTHIKSRKDFYDWLTQKIRISGISNVERDTEFDDLPQYRSAGIKLNYTTVVEAMEGLRDGVLLEVGFDTVAPNTPKDISSWLYDRAAASNVDVIDNRATEVPCYDAGYTFVEKLQTVSTKFRKQQADGSDPVGFMRHYYDVYELLRRKEVQDFIGTDAYKAHKKARFRSENQNIAENDAFILSGATTRAQYADAYERSSALYYADKPTFEQILAEISNWAERL